MITERGIAAMQTTANEEIKIRTATPEDAEALAAIYAPYVENTSITFEYVVPTVEEFADRIRRTLTRYPYLVAEKNGIPVGYAYASAFKGRAAYDWSVETSIYVRLDVRSSGVGSLLYQKLEEYLTAQHICKSVPASLIRILPASPSMKNTAMRPWHIFMLPASSRGNGMT